MVCDLLGCHLTESECLIESVRHMCCVDAAHVNEPTGVTLLQRLELSKLRTVACGACKHAVHHMFTLHALELGIWHC